VAFYSRTGTTKRVAEKLAQLLTSDVEEIFDTTNRMGFFNWLRSGRDAGTKRLTVIRKTEKDPSFYDVVVVGSPVWNSSMSSPVRTYLSQSKGLFKGVAFFLTSNGSSANDEVFAEMAEVSGKTPVATLALRKKTVMSEQYDSDLDKFVKDIMKT